MRILLILLLTFSLGGCSLFGRERPIEVTATPGTRLPLLIAEPEPLSLRSPGWIVVTPENIDQVWQRLSESNTDLVLFALTDDGYELLSLNLAEVRIRIQLQREIIKQYKEYYEGQR